MTRSSAYNLLLYGFIATLIYFPLAMGSTRPMTAAPGQIMIQVITIGTLFYFYYNQTPLPGAVKAAKVPITLLIVFLILQTTLHVLGIHYLDVENIREQLVKTICLIEIFCLTLILVDSGRKLKLLVTALILSGVFQAMYGSITLAVFDLSNASGTYVNRNHLAGYLEMTLGLGIGLLIASLDQGASVSWRHRLRRWTATLLGEKARVRIYLALMVIGLIQTQSRMGNTAFFSSMLIAGGLGLFLFRRSSRGVVILFSSLLIIDIFLMGAFFGIDKLQTRIEQTDVARDGRLDVNQLGTMMIKDELISGTGLGTWYTNFTSYRDHRIAGMYRHSHSDIVEFQTEVGLAGTSLLVLFLLHSFVKAIRVQISRRHQLMRAMGFGATMAIISIFIHSFTDFNLQVLANAATFLVVLALPYLAATLSSRLNQSPELQVKPG